MMSKGGLCRSFCVQVGWHCAPPNPPAFVTAIHACQCHRFRLSPYFPVPSMIPTPPPFFFVRPSKFAAVIRVILFANRWGGAPPPNP